MNEYLEEALDFYLGETEVCGEETLKSQVRGYGRGETSHKSKMTNSKPELKLWEVEP